MQESTQTDKATPQHPAQARVDRLEQMTPSAIRAVHNLAVQLQAAHPERTFIPLHFGEGDLGTPEFIVEAGVEALKSGAVYYENNSGRPDLTRELAEHTARIFGVSLLPEQFVVTCGGVQAIALSMLGLLSPGDDIINITPAWPNFREAARIAGARVHDLALDFDESAGSFRLDLARLESLAAGLQNLRMVVVNSPSNPTGYVMPEPDKQAMLTFCRERGVYLMADEMYDRLVFMEAPPRSFLQLAVEADRLVVINGFSKAYSMTGWRLGYLITRPDLAARLAQMQEFLTSCAPSMAQVAAIKALREGEAYVEQNRARYAELRNLTLDRLKAIPGCVAALPQGAFYAFFRLPGSENSLEFCKALLVKTGVSLAPGVAFGAGGEGWLRLCFAKEPHVLEQALESLRGFIQNSDMAG